MQNTLIAHSQVEIPYENRIPRQIPTEVFYVYIAVISYVQICRSPDVQIFMRSPNFRALTSFRLSLYKLILERSPDFRNYNKFRGSLFRLACVHVQISWIHIIYSGLQCKTLIFQLQLPSITQEVQIFNTTQKSEYNSFYAFEKLLFDFDSSENPGRGVTAKNR